MLYNSPTLTAASSMDRRRLLHQRRCVCQEKKTLTGESKETFSVSSLVVFVFVFTRPKGKTSRLHLINARRKSFTAPAQPQLEREPPTLKVPKPDFRPFFLFSSRLFLLVPRSPVSFPTSRPRILTSRTSSNHTTV